jgi:hypothetical protein
MLFCGLNSDSFDIVPFRQGMWNKLYLLNSKDEKTGTITPKINSHPIPSNLWYTLESNVGTIEYVHAHTSIPVPKIFVSDSSMINALGFECMIIEKLKGEPYSDTSIVLSFEVQKELNRTVAGWVDELSRLQIDRIGSLYRQ